jgi:hypothetical protein
MVSPDRRPPPDQGTPRPRPPAARDDQATYALAQEGTCEAAGNDHAAQVDDRVLTAVSGSRSPSARWGPAAGWHRSARRVNRWPGRRLRVGDPVAVQGNLARHHARWWLGRGIAQAGKTRGPASASRGSRLRGARTRARYSASSRGSLVIASSPQRRSARHRPKSHAPRTKATTRTGGPAGRERPVEPAACRYPGRWSAPAGRQGGGGTSMALSHLTASVLPAACGPPEPLRR